MLLFNILFVVAGASGLLAAAFWVRVASSRSIDEAFRLDGTERLSERANRRALTGAILASGLTAVLAGAAYFVGRSVNVF